MLYAFGSERVGVLPGDSYSVGPRPRPGRLLAKVRPGELAWPPRTEGPAGGPAGEPAGVRAGWL